MAAIFTAEEIMELTGARLASGMMPDEGGPIVIDTRLGVEGAWFVALPGLKYDGHDFLGDAFNGGALGCIVSDRPAYPIASTAFPLLAVSSGEVALAELARNWRRRTLKKLCLVAAAGVDEQNFESVAAYLLTQRADGEASAVRILKWHSDCNTILSQFLNLDEEETFLLADFAPQPLTQMSDLLKQLAPNLFVLPVRAFDYDRLNLSNDQALNLKIEVARSLATQTKPHCLVVTDEQALAEQLAITFVTTFSDQRLAKQMGL